MSDNKNETGPQDASRVNVHEAYELQYWKERFGVSSEALKSAVEAVGPSVKAVEDYFRQRKSA